MLNDCSKIFVTCSPPNNRCLVILISAIPIALLKNQIDTLVTSEATPGLNRYSGSQQILIKENGR